MELKTPLRIAQFDIDEYFWIEDVDGNTVADDGSAAGENFPKMTRETASRFVACVNDCAGISTEQLELDIATGGQKSLFECLEATVGEVTKQRDQLLAVAKEALELVESERRGCDRDIVSKLHAAIAAVEQPSACADHRTITQHMGDDTPVEFCPECGKNEIADLPTDSEGGEA